MKYKSIFPTLIFLLANSVSANENSPQFNTFSSFTLAQEQYLQVGEMKLFMQSDGNLVLFRGSTPLWHSQTYVENCAYNCFATFEETGNLVVAHGSTGLWSSATHHNPGAKLVVSTAEPYLKIVNTEGSILWASSNKAATPSLSNQIIATEVRPGTYSSFTLQTGQSLQYLDLTLVMQVDGNLVLYKDLGTASQKYLWASFSAASCAANECRAVFYGDGQLVVYNGNTQIWHSGTYGENNAYLTLGGSKAATMSIINNGYLRWESVPAPLNPNEIDMVDYMVARYASSAEYLLAGNQTKIR